MQRGKPNVDGDRHGIVVDPVNRKLYEFYRLTKTDDGWQAACRRRVRPEVNKLRPDGWTSLRRRRPADLPGRRPLRRAASAA